MDNSRAPISAGVLGRLLPRCSVVIPTYNRATRVGLAIESALAQLLEGDELIVVDDGSTDDTVSVLSKYASRIVVVHGSHRGAGAARNLGIAHARNELVAFLDSDDLWLPGKLQLQRQLMARQQDVLYCFGNFEVQFGDGTIQHLFLDQWLTKSGMPRESLGRGMAYSSLAELPVGQTDFEVYSADFYSLQLTAVFILTDTLVIRREAAADALTFAEDLPTYEDLECFFRLAKRGRGVLLDVELARQVDHGEGRLSNCPGLRSVDARLELLKRHWGQDAEFLRAQGGRYRDELDRVLGQKAGHLITLGRGREASEVLRSMSESPLMLRMLAALPKSASLAGLNLYRVVRGTAAKIRRSSSSRSSS